MSSIFGAGVWSCGPKAVEGTGFILKQVFPPTSVSVLRGTTNRSAATFGQYRRRGLMNFIPIWKGTFYYSTRWETVFELHFWAEGMRIRYPHFFFSLTIWYNHKILCQIVYVQFKIFLIIQKLIDFQPCEIALFVISTTKQQDASWNIHLVFITHFLVKFNQAEKKIPKSLLTRMNWSMPI